MKINYVCEKKCQEETELRISKEKEGLIVGRKGYTVHLIKTLYGTPIDEIDTGIVNLAVSRYNPSIGKYGSLHIELSEDKRVLRLYNPKAAINSVYFEERETGKQWELTPGSEYFFAENKESTLDIYVGELSEPYYVGTLRIKRE